MTPPPNSPAHRRCLAIPRRTRTGFESWFFISISNPVSMAKRHVVAQKDLSKSKRSKKPARFVLFEPHATLLSVDVSDRAASALIKESFAESDVEFEDRREAWNRLDMPLSELVQNDSWCQQIPHQNPYLEEALASDSFAHWVTGVTDRDSTCHSGGSERMGKMKLLWA